MQKNKTTIFIILALLLGVGSYMGGTVLFTGQNPLNQLLGRESPLVSDIPTDEDGRNLYGNHMANLANGGLVTMQGRDVFYVNLMDGGSLYCQDARGNITKLTDFAAANLNVVGERLIFTDLQYCVAISENSEPIAISADNHQELWEAAGEEARISYGGNLYCIDGVRSYLAGDIEFEQLDFHQMAGDAFYLSPIVAEGYFLVITVGETGVGDITDITDITPLAHQGDITPRAHQGDIKSTPLANRGSMNTQPLTNRGRATTMPLAAQVYNSSAPNTVSVVNSQGKEQNYQGSSGDHIVKSSVVGGKVYVETKQYSTKDGDHNQKITIIDPETGKVIGHYEGQNLQTSNEGAYFQNGDRVVRIDPQDNSAAQVNIAPADTYMTVSPDGTIRYQTTLDPGPPRTMIDMKTKRQEDGQNYTGRDMSRAEWLFYKGKTYVFGGEIVGFERNSKQWARGEVEKTGLFSRETTVSPLDDWNKVRDGEPLNPTLVADIGGIVPITAEEEAEARRKKAEERQKATPTPDPMEAFTRGTDDDDPVADSTPIPTAAPTPTPTPSQPASGIPNWATKLAIGDVVRVGPYDWKVLEVKDGKALIISVPLVAEMAYHTDGGNITWENSSIRQYLNGEFLNVFSAEERALIAETRVVNENNPNYGTSGGNDTDDYVFLLSISELQAYLPPTNNDPYAYDARRAYYENGDEENWWLRTPGRFESAAANTRDGAWLGTGVHQMMGVRPAMWLKMK